MRLRYIGALVALILVLPLFGFVVAAQAQGFRTGDNATVKPDETINGSLYLAGQHIDIAGVVHGDIYCAGQTVAVGGEVDGDVLCAAQSVHITGKVSGDVRVAGQTVDFSGNVSGSVTAMGQSVTVDQTASIGRDMTIMASGANFNGAVGRDMVANVETLQVNGRLGRNLHTNVSKLTLGKSANVGGSIEYSSQKKLTRSAEAKVLGDINFNAISRQGHGKGWRIFGFSVIWFLYWYAALMLVALVLLLLFPKLFAEAVEKADKHPWRTALYGFLTIIAAPAVLIGLMLTVVGIPLSGFLFALYLLAMFTTGPLFSFFLGGKLLRKQQRPVVTMLVGATVLLVAYFIPIIGFIAFMATGFVGMGMFVTGLTQRLPKPKTIK